MSASSEVSVSWGQALAWRLGRQMLDPVGSESTPDVVRRLGTMLSLEESMAELAVRTRRTTSLPGELAQALADGTIIRAFAFRGAVHYFTPEDAGVYLAIRSAGRQWELPSWVDHYGLTAAAWPGFRAVVREALRDGPLTMAEIGEALARQRPFRHLGPHFEGNPWALIKALSWQGDLSLGPRRNGQVTFQSLELNPRWTGIPDLEEAGPRAITAYLGSYGPATVDQIHYWFGEGLSAGRKRINTWLTQLADRVVAVDIDGTTAYVVQGDVDSLMAAQPTAAVRFLPGHDQWVMGLGTKDVRVTPSALRTAVTRKANPVIAGGVVCGTWTRKGDVLTVTWLNTGRLPEEHLQDEAGRLAIILGRPLELVIA